MLDVLNSLWPIDAITYISFKIIYVKFHSTHLGANELIHPDMRIKEATSQAEICAFL